MECLYPADQLNVLLHLLVDQLVLLHGCLDVGDDLVDCDVGRGLLALQQQRRLLLAQIDKQVDRVKCNDEVLYPHHLHVANVLEEDLELQDAFRLYEEIHEALALDGHVQRSLEEVLGPLIGSHYHRDSN